MKRYKVLNEDMSSPFQGMVFEIGKEYICNDFDTSDDTCSQGFYATDIEGLTYSLRQGRKVFECEVSGKKKEFDQYKMRYEKIKFIREIEIGELDELVLKETDKLDYNLYRAIYPINPLTDIPKSKVTEIDINNLKKWGSVSDSVWDSVWGSVWDSVWGSVRGSVSDSVWDSVWGSVRDSVWGSVSDSVRGSVWYSVRDSVGAYISSLFPKIEKWDYIKHKPGENPFQSAIDLWHRGFVPSYDGKIGRLHQGPKAEIVYELKE